MAFMMPVMKNDYNIYSSRSRTSSNNSVPSRRHTQSESAPVSLSSSPGSDVEERLAAISLGCSPRRGSRLDEVVSTSKSASSSSLHKFHSKVVEKLRRKLRSSSRDESSSQAENSTASSNSKQTTSS
ncbi:hypothetical protein JTE90_015646 [Oedothorax gibbosus]|uniref:Uncharacterized protein n=1 Tax=Oedothorax gibbosus TaxID=931172 RepID=A0AAV6URH8_9ARAC|nr:hypothetical protein JTE90_015646 [Oedothorax gibbosus]